MGAGVNLLTLVLDFPLIPCMGVGFGDVDSENAVENQSILRINVPDLLHPGPHLIYPLPVSANSTLTDFKV